MITTPDPILMTLTPRTTPRPTPMLPAKPFPTNLFGRRQRDTPILTLPPNNSIPPTIYGWFVKDYPTPKSVAELNGNKFLYELIQKDVKFPTWPITTIAHNRDVAKAHVLALTAPILPRGEKKRIIISFGTMTWVDAIEFLKLLEVVAKFKERAHDIVARLSDVSAAGLQMQYSLDTSLTESVLGLNEGDYIPWKEILLEVMPNLMDWEQVHHAEAL
ncbi:hypothetical protein D9756_006453 [Leucocoprinus leucothites]|uniref:Uncharacterized protein n=1 Tax=Leucocoprinus leucothites TaxID=201217 RepID=A0A8H5G2I7_9AGAR|nr:hypothetical protein D9756_006453 [Leucoagaricus leucothites]